MTTFQERFFADNQPRFIIELEKELNRELIAKTFEDHINWYKQLYSSEYGKRKFFEMVVESAWEEFRRSLWKTYLKRRVKSLTGKTSNQLRVMSISELHYQKKNSINVRWLFLANYPELLQRGYKLETVKKLKKICCNESPWYDALGKEIFIALLVGAILVITLVLILIYYGDPLVRKTTKFFRANYLDPISQNYFVCFILFCLYYVFDYDWDDRDLI